MIAARPDFIVPLLPKTMESLAINAQLDNIGHTPAINVVHNENLIPYSGKSREELLAFLTKQFTTISDKFRVRSEEVIGRGLTDIARVDVAPNAPTWSTLVIEPKLGEEDFENLQSGKTLLFYIGIVRYTDGFNMPYETQFCEFFYGTNPRVWHICQTNNTIK